MIICWLNHHWSEYEWQAHIGAIQGPQTINTRLNDQLCHFHANSNPYLKFVIFSSRCSCEHAHWYPHIDLEFTTMFPPGGLRAYPTCCLVYLWFWWVVIFLSACLSKIIDSSTRGFELRLRQCLDASKVHWDSRIITSLPCWSSF